MEIVTRSYPGQHAEISRLRSQNPTFAEICRDYELLMSLLPRDTEDPTYRDIRDSLTGLEQEIGAYLGLPQGQTGQR